MPTPTLSRIEIFPVKSLDGVTVTEATFLPSGALKGDRQYALLDARGMFINGKANPLVHRLRSTFSPDLEAMTLRVQGTELPVSFRLTGDRTALEQWLSQYFKQPVTVAENAITGFPDDLNAPGPTVVTTATLNAVATWYPALDLTEIRRRFRTNLEIAETPPFWEDQLYRDPHQAVLFQIGLVRLLGTNPCQRCIVPTRNSLEGEAESGFQRQFVQHRQTHLPDWAMRSQFNHFYKLAVNTQLDANTPSYSLRIGDTVQL